MASLEQPYARAVLGTWRMCEAYCRAVHLNSEGKVDDDAKAVAKTSWSIARVMSEREQLRPCRAHLFLI